MDGFKNSTKTQYMQGGAVDGYAKGGKTKGAAKISKVMGEFKRGELHSGSKEGPKVASRKQATAIALSEARDAGAKFNGGGRVKKGMPAEGVSSRPRDAKGRPLTIEDLNRANRDVGGLSAAGMQATRERVARGNRTPRERIPTDVEVARALSPYKKGGLAVMPRGKKC